MEKIKKIKERLHDLFCSKYVITKNKVLSWLIYRQNGQPKIARILGITYVLAKDESSSYSRQLSKAKTFNKLSAYLLLWYLKRGNQPGTIYRLVKVGSAIFITDLTGLTNN